MGVISTSNATNLLKSILWVGAAVFALGVAHLSSLAAEDNSILAPAQSLELTDGVPNASLEQAHEARSPRTA